MELLGYGSPQTGVGDLQVDRELPVRVPDGTSIPIGVKRHLALRMAAVSDPKSRDRRPPSTPTQ